MRLTTGTFVYIVAATLAAILLPAATSAQTGASGIAGVVKDTSGAVLPGVSVEAASPALIEKVRSVVTDGEGQYKIIDLRPGTYEVTFTLPGFGTVKRDGVELSGACQIDGRGTEEIVADDVRIVTELLLDRLTDAG